MEELLNDKKIIIVGPCKNLIGKKLGEYIDSFDIVVRIKKGYPVPNNLKEDLGTKTNLLYTTLRMDNDSNNLKKDDVKNINDNNVLICYPQPLIKQYLKMYKLFTKKYPNQKLILNKKNPDYYKFLEIATCEPTIMTFAIMHLKNYNFNKLECIGFSFRKYGYYPEYKSLEKDKESFNRTYSSGYHSIEKERDFLNKLCEDDKRINIITEINK
jgi:hypothetical protein